MRFSSPDSLSFIQIDRRDEDGHAIFDVWASIEGFSGRNESVIFTGCTEFLRQLRAFDAKREGVVVLEGTEECKLSISAFDNAGHMRVDVSLCKYSCQHGTRTVVLKLEAGFAFDAEFANRIFQELHELLRDCI